MLFYCSVSTSESCSSSTDWPQFTVHMMVMNRKLFKGELVIVELQSPVLSVLGICMSLLGPYPKLVTPPGLRLCFVRGQ